MSHASDELAFNEKVQRLRSLLATDQSVGWIEAWQEGVTPWDQGTPQPALTEILKSGEVNFPTSGKALVPGCGRGYDAIHIATQLGLETLGVDLSPLAVEKANADLNSHSAIVPAVNVSFKTTDFFTFSLPDDELFDLVYDYTFFCAIPPSLRAAWGHQMSSLTKPGAFLVTLVFPLDGAREGGPPYSVNVGLYRDCLGPEWDVVVDRAPDNGSEAHRGRERIVVWKKTDSST